MSVSVKHIVEIKYIKSLLLRIPDGKNLIVVFNDIIKTADLVLEVKQQLEEIQNKMDILDESDSSISDEEYYSDEDYEPPKSFDEQLLGQSNSLNL